MELLKKDIFNIASINRMPSFVFATNNKNKVTEIRSLLNGEFEVITLKEAGINIDIPEPHDSLEENAREKSKVIYDLTGKDCFSEDSGLEVFSLGNEPGVRSARYAGEENDPKKNIEKLLHNLKANLNRKAQFRTVISLMISGKETQFEGICEGEILTEIKGTNGFGYDAIFTPAGSVNSFGEMTLEEKNKFSHRKKATAKLIEFLKDYYGKD